MKNKMLVQMLIFCLLLPAAGRGLRAQEEPQRYMDFDRISIFGRVYDESRNPLAGIKVEIRLAYDAQAGRPEIMGASDIQDYVWQNLVTTVGSGVFAWAESDETGLYRINGVPDTGAYFLVVRHAEAYLQTQVPVIVHKTGAKELEADIVLRARHASEAKPVSKEALKKVAKAKEDMAAKKIDKAIGDLKEAIEIEPEFAEAHYNLGILLRQKGKIDEAVIHFTKAVEFQPDYKLALFALGETLQAKKEYAPSNTHLETYLKLVEGDASPATARAHELAGTNSFNLQQPKQAIRHFTRAIEINPQIGPNAYLLLANSHVIERDGPAAIKVYRKYIELYPEAPNNEQVKVILEKLESMYPDEKKQ